MCCKRSFDSFAAPQDFAWPPLPLETVPYGYHSRSIRELVAAGESYASVKARVCRLTNGLHTCFDRERFVHYDDEYDYFYELEPALRLASAMLTHQDSLPFWHALMTSGQRHKDASEKELFPSFSPKPKLTEKETLETLRLLEYFSDNMIIGVSDKVSECADACTGGCEVREYHKEFVPDKKLWHMPNAQREEFFSTISLKKSYIEGLREWIAPDSERKIYEVRLQIFRLSATVLHEFAHAVACYYYGNDRAPFMTTLGANDVTETGYQLEHWLFGGSPEVQDELGMLYVRRFPDVTFVQTFVDNECDAIAIKGLVTYHQRLWWVSDGHINHLFHDAFWSHDASRGRKQLRLPRAEFAKPFGEQEFLDSAPPDDATEIKRRKGVAMDRVTDADGKPKVRSGKNDLQGHKLRHAGRQCDRQIEELNAMFDQTLTKMWSSTDKL